MARQNRGAIEGEIDRLRSLDLEELRRDWRRLYHGEPPHRGGGIELLGDGHERHAMGFEQLDQLGEVGERRAMLDRLRWGLPLQRKPSSVTVA